MNNAPLLYPEQQQALNQMFNGCILCGATGSGKSRTALTYYAKTVGLDLESGELSIDKVPNLYIITTAQKRDKLEWEDEMVHFLLNPNPEFNFHNNQVIVDSWNNITKYVDVKGAFFIFDEQRVIGKGTWAKTFIKIARNNQWILLSATPGDCWEDYIPVFIANGFYKNRTEFELEHIVWDRRCSFPKIDRWLNTGKLIRLRNKILIDIPVHRETVRHEEVIRTIYDRDLYKRITKERWNIWDDIPIDNASGLCLAWRRVVNEDESKQVALLELTEKHPKMIVFYNYDYELDILRNLVYPDGTEIAEWNGHKHQEIPITDRWVYLVQYTAGCEGWNCILTDTIVFYSKNYSYRTMMQAKGRIDRLNTPFTDLYYYSLESLSPIDIAINKALESKKNFNEGQFVNRR